MIDGGVFANNPTMCAIVKTKHLYGTADQMPDILVVFSVRAATQFVLMLQRRCIGESCRGQYQSSPSFQDGNAQTVAFEAEELIDDYHWRLDVSLTTKTPEGETVNASFIDDASPENIKALVNKAKQTN